jgi:hypothetical protein
MTSGTVGTEFRVDFEMRYGDLTDEFEQMFSAEAAPRPDCAIDCGRYMASLVAEMKRYLITQN